MENIKNKYRNLKLAGSAPNCGIVAIAYAVNMPLNTVTSDFKEVLNFHGNWKGRTSTRDRKTLMDLYGLKYIQLEYKSNTFGKWVKNEMNRNKHYLVRVTNHVFNIDKGILIDQYSIIPAGSCNKLKKRMRDVLEIIN